MSAEKRPWLSSDASNKLARRKKSRVSTLQPPNALSALNAFESPFLKLPAELRNRIYELIFTVNVIHVEHESNSDPDIARAYQIPSLTTAGKRKFFRFYLCKAELSESEAYRRSVNATLDERIVQDEETTSKDLQPNHWRMGDRFHIDSCKERHKACVPPPRPAGWLALHSQPNERFTNPAINLKSMLSLNLLRVCSQIHHEASIFPYSLNAFAFRQVSAFLKLISSLPAAQAQAIKEICFSMTAGHNNSDETLCSRWNSHLFMPDNLLDRLCGLRILHISISIMHHELGNDGPLRSDLANPSELHGWVIGLERLRGLALDDVTVIVSDDPASKFGIDGAHEALKYLVGHFHGSWGAMREAECFTANEKRQWAERIRSRLLMKKAARSLGSARPEQGRR